VLVNFHCCTSDCCTLGLCCKHSLYTHSNTLRCVYCCNVDYLRQHSLIAVTIHSVVHDILPLLLSSLLQYLLTLLLLMRSLFSDCCYCQRRRCSIGWVCYRCGRDQRHPLTASLFTLSFATPCRCCQRHRCSICWIYCRCWHHCSLTAVTANIIVALPAEFAIGVDVVNDNRWVLSLLTLTFTILCHRWWHLRDCRHLRGG